jgi:WD40 repeat protein
LQKKRYSAYGASNIINLLLACQIDLNQYNWRDRYLRAIDFQNLNLQDLDFSGSTFDRCRFSQGMGTLLGLVFSPDGKLIAASDTSFQIKIWSVADNSEIALLRGHQGWVWDVTFSPDSRYLASGSSDRTLRIWDVKSGECLQAIDAHDDWVWKIGFLFSNQLIMSLGADRYVKVWLWKTGTSSISMTVPDTGHRDAAFHGRGFVATCGYEQVNIWHIWTARKLHTIPMMGDMRIKKVTFSHDGKVLIGISTSLTIYGWDVDSGECCLSLSGHPSQVNEVKTLDTGEIISTCLEQLRVWNSETGDCLQVINFAGKGTISIAYYPRDG